MDKDAEELIQLYEESGAKNTVRLEIAAAAIMLGADSFPMWKVEKDPWKWSFERFRNSAQVQKYIQDTVHQQFNEDANEEERARVILGIAFSALDELKKVCDKALACEEASTSRI